MKRAAWKQSAWAILVGAMTFSLAAFWIADNARAEVLLDEHIQTISLPFNAADTKGYTIDLKWNGPTSSGYMAVDISVKSTSTFASDRRLTLRIEPVDQGHLPPQNGMSYDLPLSINQGTKVKNVQRMLPKWSIGNGYQIRIFDNGNERERYRAEIGQLLRMRSLSRPPRMDSEEQIDWLIVGDAGQGKNIDGFINDQMTLRPIYVPSMTKYPSRSHRVAANRFPDDWRALQSMDVVMIEQNDLRQLSEQSPPAFSSLRDWILCGGTVVVLNAESSDKTAADLNFKYVLDPSINAVRDYHISQLRSGHRDFLIELDNAIIDAKTRAANGMRSVGFERDLQTIRDIKADAIRHSPHPQQSSHVGLQSVGAGQIVNVSSQSRLDRHDLGLIASLLGYRRSPMLRRGVDPLLGDRRAKRWLIPGVAQPPVYTFMGLLTIFVLLVGPVAYRQTTKSGRGYLMFAIAPALAIITTATMLIYGVLSDGFGTQSRIRQLTWIDGQSGDAGERIRGTYFSGVRPPDGIAFRGDAEVMIYPDNNFLSWESTIDQDDGSMGNVVVTNDRQQFDNHFMPARVQQQFVVHRPQRKLGRLKLVWPSVNGTFPKIASEFDFDVRDVVVRDHDGDYWAIDAIPANTPGVDCRKTLPKEASKLLGDLYNRHRLLAATRESQANRKRRRNETQDILAQLNHNLSNEYNLVLDGTFELWLQQRLQIAGELPKGCFVAVSDVSDDAVWIDDAKSVDSVRYVFGSLP